MPGARSGSFVCLMVSDTGIGMRKEVVNHIFEPYYSTKKERLGIGLSVVYGIVKQHNGWITVDSLPGQGTTFKIYLPASDEVVMEKEQDIFSLDLFKGNKERVLLVDDDKSVRDVVKRILEINGYIVTEAGSSQEALFISEAEKASFDLLFADIILPEKDGITLADALIEKNPKIKVLLSSGYPQNQSKWDEISTKGYNFILKPFGLTNVFESCKKRIK